MYFLSINNLKHDLISKKLTEYDAFLYLVSQSTIIYIAYLLKTETTTNNFDVFHDITSLFILILATYYCYVCNNKTNGTDFLLRFISISWVVTIRFVLITAILYVPFSIIRDGKETGLIDVIFNITLDIALYYRISHHIKIISNNT